MQKRQIKQTIILIIVLTTFVVSSYFSNTYTEYLQEYMGDFPVFGMLLYLIGLIIATVISPISLLPVLPVAVALWGPFASAMLTNIGWTIGAIIAFSISQKYGPDVVEKFISTKQLEWVKKRIPKDHLFISVVIFRIAIPVDFISYALGLFTDMNLKSYTLATFLGSVPLTFALAYAIRFPDSLQVWTVIVGTFLIVLGYTKSKQLLKSDN